MIDCLALLAERNSLAAIHRVKGLKEETVMAWLRIAATQVERTHALLMANYKLTRANQCPQPGPGSSTHLIAASPPAANILWRPKPCWMAGHCSTRGVLRGTGAIPHTAPTI